MKDQYSVRPVLLKDINGIQRVAELSWRDTYQSIFPETFIDDFLKRAYSKESLDAVIQRDLTKYERRFILVESQEEIVGYAHFSDVSIGEIEILRIYVMPDFQGKGLGKSMILNQLNSDPTIRRIFAWVEEENLKGIGFYEANGFDSGEDKTEEINGQKLRLKKYIKAIL